MPSFTCQVCGTSFEVSASAIAKYSGWTPKYCREHSPSKKKSRAPSREENLTVAEVLKKYSGGPQTGVFTDGSSAPNPGPGGWGAVWVEDGEIVAQNHGRDPATTSNRMELTALIEAYRLLPEDAETTLLTDSRLCVNTINEWAPKWELKGWTKKGGPIKNLELVQELLALHRAHPKCSLEWIQSHSGHLWNEYADSLATAWQRSEV
jgi:ribonuclease HI